MAHLIRLVLLGLKIVLNVPNILDKKLVTGLLKNNAVAFPKY